MENLHRFFRAVPGGIFVLLLACSLRPIEAAAQVYFAPAVPIEAGFSPRTIFPADLDGDGDLDVLTATATDNKIAWNENLDGLGNFGPTVVVSAGVSNSHFAYPIDLDADGRLDILAPLASFQNISWFKNTDGLGSFGSQQAITPPVNNCGMALPADLDGDGDQDLMIYRFNDVVNPTVRWFYWMENVGGAASFVHRDTLSINEVSSVFQAADLDGDNDLDILAANPNDTLIWFENLNGLGSFSSSKIISPNHDGPVGIFAADLDGDNDLDVLCADRLDDKVSWYENLDGMGNFGPEKLLIVAFDGPERVIAADLDNDGDLDVVANSKNTNRIVWFENLDGGGNFSAEQLVADNVMGAFELQAADVDGDGDIDLLSSGNNITGAQFALYRNLFLERKIGGVCFFDQNENQVQDPGEVGLLNQQVAVSPLGLGGFTAPDGTYFMSVADGTCYQAVWVPHPDWELTTSPASYQVQVLGADVTGLDFGLRPTNTISRVEPVLAHGPTRCGFTVPFWVNYTNTGTTFADGFARFVLDAGTSLVSADPAPTAMTGDTLYWDFEQLPPSYSEGVLLFLHIPSVASIGDTLQFFTETYLSDAGGNLSLNSSYETFSVVQCAVDPNDKLVRPVGNTPAHLTLFDEILEYTIRFQNTGTDTAFTVRLEDQLDGDLDWSSFQPVAASHAYRAVIDGDGLATVVFDQIMLPDSNVNEPESHGFFTFRIRALAGLPDFTAVENSAGIFFYFNDAVVTNTTLNTLVPLLPAVISAQPVTCHGGQDGSFSAAPVVGNLPITFTLAGVGSNETGIFQNLAGGLYMLTMEDATGHTVSQPVEIPEPDAIVDSFVLSICQHEPSPATGTVYDVPGDYQEQVTLQTPDGCDSLVVASLVVYPEELLVVDNGPLPYGTVYHGVVLTQDTQFVYFDTTEFGCLLTISENVTVSPSSTNEVTVAIGLSIRPNPVEDYFTVSFETDFPAAVSLRLTDALGRPVRELKPVHTSGIHTYTFDTAELAAGIYFLHLNIGDHWASKILTKI
ncbi:MAG: T9SS type A sorting domain-containing protein [Saprospiraceae bacterium]|nr:T9SS type A sorting domain-containing protein [Saprospiraceae bacterium]